LDVVQLIQQGSRSVAEHLHRFRTAASVLDAIRHHDGPDLE